MQIPASVFEPGGLLRARDFLARRGSVIAAVAASTLLVVVLLLHLMPMHYRARTEVLLDPRRHKTFGPDDAAASATLDAASVESAMAQIRGNDVLTRVVRAEHLAADPRFNGLGVAGGHNGALAWLGRLVGRRTPEETTAERYAVGALYRALKVERVGKGYVLSIDVAALEPHLAARLANGVAQAFVADERDARLEATRREATFFADRLGPLGEQLRRSEDALDRFRRDHNLAATNTAGAAVGGRASTLNEQQLGELNSRLAQARADTSEAWARFDATQSTVKNGGGMEALPDVVRSPLIGQLRQQHAEVSRREADLAARYSDAYPALQTVRAERREAERAIAREMARIVGTLKNAYDVAKSREDGLRADVALATGAAGLDNDIGRQLRELERLRLVDQTVFETYLAHAKAAEQQATFEEHEARVVSPATDPVVPAFPQTRIVLFCALLLGLGLGTALGLALDAVAAGFLSEGELEAALGYPVLGSVARLRRGDRTVGGEVLDPARLLVRRPHGAYADTIHAARAALDLGSRGGVLTLVTSTKSGEGKSTLALGLALSATLAGRRVLMIDADLRNPTLSREVGADTRLGLVDMLAGLVGTAETTVALGPQLALMPAGRGTPLAADLFGSARMARYLAYVGERYDLVVIDAAPLGASPEAAVLARCCDRVMFVIGWRDTARAAVTRSLARLRPTGRPVGLVLNKVEARRTFGSGRSAMPARRRTAEAEA